MPSRTGRRPRQCGLRAHIPCVRREESRIASSATRVWVSRSGTSPGRAVARRPPTAEEHLPTPGIRIANLSLRSRPTRHFERARFIPRCCTSHRRRHGAFDFSRPTPGIVVALLTVMLINLITFAGLTILYFAYDLYVNRFRPVRSREWTASPEQRSPARSSVSRPDASAEGGKLHSRRGIPGAAALPRDRHMPADRHPAPARCHSPQCGRTRPLHNAQSACGDLKWRNAFAPGIRARCRPPPVARFMR
jgi:hypothetical protein